MTAVHAIGRFIRSSTLTTAPYTPLKITLTCCTAGGLELDDLGCLSRSALLYPDRSHRRADEPRNFHSSAPGSSHLFVPIICPIYDVDNDLQNAFFYCRYVTSVS